MLFSIIVPIYNVESYIEKCINSIIKQTYENIEIILVDDESPDKCPQICDNYAKLDKRIVVIHKKNGGLSDARNKGIEAARGDYIIFVDSDDYIDTHTCELLLPYTYNAFDIIIGNAIIEGGKANLDHCRKDNSIFSGKDYLIEALKCNMLPMAAWLNIYRREFLTQNNLKFKYKILHEDEQFTPRAILKAKSLICTDICFYHYSIRENSITTKRDKRKNADDFYSTSLELTSIYKDIDDKWLRNRLLDSLTSKYLSIFQSGMLFRYGKIYYRKIFLLSNTKLPKTYIKMMLYSFSPKIYCLVNEYTKKQSEKKE